MLVSPAVEVVVSWPPLEPSVVETDSVVVEDSAATDVVDAVSWVVLSAAHAATDRTIAADHAAFCSDGLVHLPSTYSSCQ